MEGAVFESEKCAVLGEASARLCLTSNQGWALSLIPSEDHRLETMEHLPFGHRMDRTRIAELFQLNFIERALAVRKALKNRLGFDGFHNRATELYA